MKLKVWGIFRCDVLRNGAWSSSWLCCRALGANNSKIGPVSHDNVASETHVHRFGMAWLDVVGDDSMRCAVVGLDWCGQLFVAHLFKKFSHGDCFTSVDVKSTQFGFGCTGHDGLEYL